MFAKYYRYRTIIELLIDSAYSRHKCDYTFVQIPIVSNHLEIKTISALTVTMVVFSEAKTLYT